MEVLFYVGFVLFVLFGPWILLWRVNSRRKSDRLEDQLRWADITGRIHALERDLKELRAQGTAQAAPPPAKQEVTSPPPAAPFQAPLAEPAVSNTPSQAVAEEWVRRKVPEPPSAAPPPAAPRVPTPPSPPALA